MYRPIKAKKHKWSEAVKWAQKHLGGFPSFQEFSVFITLINTYYPTFCHWQDFIDRCNDSDLKMSRFKYDFKYVWWKSMRQFVYGHLDIYKTGVRTACKKEKGKKKLNLELDGSLSFVQCEPANSSNPLLPFAEVAYFV